MERREETGGEALTAEGCTARALQRAGGAPRERSRSGRGRGAPSARETLGARTDGEKLEGYPRRGVCRLPTKMRGVLLGVVRSSIVGGARDAVVSMERL